VRSLFIATVKDGVIVADGVDLAEGETVAVLLDRPANDADEVALTPEEEAELDEAEASLDRGDGIPWEQVRAGLQRE
jgi:hypothetical protein